MRAEIHEAPDDRVFFDITRRVPPERCYFCRRVTYAELLDAANGARDIVILGGGFIGVEFADECRKGRDVNVTIVEMLPRCLMLAFEEDLCQEAEAALAALFAQFDVHLATVISYSLLAFVLGSGLPALAGFVATFAAGRSATGAAPSAGGAAAGPSEIAEREDRAEA